MKRAVRVGKSRDLTTTRTQDLRAQPCAGPQRQGCRVAGSLRQNAPQGDREPLCLFSPAGGCLSRLLVAEASPGSVVESYTRGTTITRENWWVSASDWVSTRPDYHTPHRDGQCVSDAQRHPTHECASGRCERSETLGARWEKSTGGALRHTRTVPSTDDVTISLPFGEKSAPVTAP
jgi:hypothetical protein